MELWSGWWCEEWLVGAWRLIGWLRGSGLDGAVVPWLLGVRVLMFGRCDRGFRCCRNLFCWIFSGGLKRWPERSQDWTSSCQMMSDCGLLSEVPGVLECLILSFRSL